MNDLKRLANLWRSRAESTRITDYPVGPGDVLEISVPGVQELTPTVTRISPEGTIAFPFVGVVQASGLTEKQLREEIRLRVEKDYMDAPQVNLCTCANVGRDKYWYSAWCRSRAYSLKSGAGSLLNDIFLA